MLRGMGIHQELIEDGQSIGHSVAVKLKGQELGSGFGNSVLLFYSFLLVKGKGFSSRVDP